MAASVLRRGVVFLNLVCGQHMGAIERCDACIVIDSVRPPPPLSRDFNEL